MLAIVRTLTDVCVDVDMTFGLNGGLSQDRAEIQLTVNEGIHIGCLFFLHSHIYVIPAFTWILTLAILLAHTVIQPITSLLTLLKGTLLIVTVITLVSLHLPV